MKTPLQDYITREVKSALEIFNSYLKFERVNFYLSQQKIQSINFVFPNEKEELQSNTAIAITLEDKLPDKYKIGRTLGEVYHKSNNPKFFDCTDLSDINKKRHRKVRLVIEHTFAMLYIQSEESDVSFDSLIDLPSAHDATPKNMQHSFIFDEIKNLTPESDIDILKEKTKKPKKPVTGIDYFIKEALKDKKDYKKRQEEDNRFDENQEKDFGASKLEFEGPDELKNYKTFEMRGGVSDNPLDIAIDKARREEFSLGKIIVEGRCDEVQTWKKTVSQLLCQDLDSAVKYLKAILEF